MLLVALFIGVILIVAAIRNSQNALFSALVEDVPAYIVWGAAIVAVGAIGYIPGLKPASRAMLALIFVVIVLKNYDTIIKGFKSAATPNVGKTDATKTTALFPGGGNFGGGGASATY